MKKVWNIRKLAQCWWCLSFAKRLLSNTEFAASYLLFISRFKVCFQTGPLSQHSSDIPNTVLQYITDQFAGYPDGLNDYVWVGRNKSANKNHHLKRSLSWKEAARLFINQQVFIVLFIDGGFPRK